MCKRRSAGHCSRPGKHWGEAVVAEAGDDKAILHIEDLIAEAAVQRLVETAIRHFGKLDAGE